MPAHDDLPDRSDDPALAPLKELRRELHRHPEIGWTEYWTTARLLTELRTLGYDVQYGKGLYPAELRHKLPPADVDAAAYLSAVQSFDEGVLAPMKGGFTGLIARKVFGKGGPKIGFRFDLDGLPITESQLPEHIPAREGFNSENGCMHACGHDGHMAIGLTLAKRLCEREGLDAEIVLLFQPAEEGGTGGLAFSHADAVGELDHVIALHIGLMEERRLITEMVFLSNVTLDVTFHGRCAHAALNPEEGRNALLAAADAVTRLYTLTDKFEGWTRVNVGEFRSDNAHNVISDRATFSVEVRGENDTLCDEMEAAAREILDDVAEKYGVRLGIVENGRYISVPSTPALKAAVKQAALEAGVPEGAIQDSHMILGSEDATYIMKRVVENGGQAVYVGLSTPTRGSHHNPLFDFDEDVMLWGADILLALVDILVKEDG